MKKKQIRFRAGQIARVKITAAVVKLLHRVHLSEGHRGQRVRIVALRDCAINGIDCHKVVDADNSVVFWMPPGALEKI